MSSQPAQRLAHDQHFHPEFSPPHHHLLPYSGQGNQSILQPLSHKGFEWFLTSFAVNLLAQQDS